MSGLLPARALVHVPPARALVHVPPDAGGLAAAPSPEPGSALAIGPTLASLCSRQLIPRVGCWGSKQRASGGNLPEGRHTHSAEKEEEEQEEDKVCFNQSVVTGTDGENNAITENIK